MDYSLYRDPVGVLLIAYSVIVLALIVERIIVRRRLSAKSRRLGAQVQKLLVRPQREQLRGLFAKSDAPLGQVMEHVLKHQVQASPETTLLLLDDSLDAAGSRLKKNLVYLAALAGTAPFLGLLGTVLGIIDTFTSIMEKGFGGPTAISAGIARALQTTAAGLIIAIPAFIAYNIFQNSANETVRDLRMQANRIFVALGDL